jgi:stearoyl-CoA desaturase (delta-9 desaturase)
MIDGLVEFSWLKFFVIVMCLTQVTIATVTIFLHRHQAHRALDLSPLPSHFFRLWLWLTTGMVTKEWAAIHRKHHAKCETVDDPHSPQILGINRVLWGGVFLYVKEAHNKETLERYGHGTPDDWIERNLYSANPKSGILLALALDMLIFGVVPGAVLWLVMVLWIPFWAAGVINGVGHFWGYRNYASADGARNILPIGIFIGGEELHNNHHTYATSAKLSNKWYEFDIGWMYIRILESMGLAKVKKVAPKAKFVGARASIDLATLQAVITHRYDVLARYLRSARLVATEEFRRMKMSAQEGKRFKRLLAQDATSLTAAAREQLSSLMAKSERLDKIVLMRAELEAIWERSSATHEQLTKQLQDWVARAEASGIRQLEEFCFNLRRYAV